MCIRDRYGAPFLVKGDAPWALMTRLSADQARLWFANRQGYGYNTAIVSLIGTTANGGPADDGATYDGIRPVSYTHLDVYKRQVQGWGQYDLQGGSRSLSLITGGPEGSRQH